MGHQQPTWWEIETFAFRHDGFCWSTCSTILSGDSCMEWTWAYSYANWMSFSYLIKGKAHSVRSVMDGLNWSVCLQRDALGLCTHVNKFCLLGKRLACYWPFLHQILPTGQMLINVWLWMKWGFWIFRFCALLKCFRTYNAYTKIQYPGGIWLGWM